MTGGIRTRAGILPAVAANWLRGAPSVWLFTVLALLPLAAMQGAESYILSLLTRALIFAIAALSLDLILGHGALVSLGHAAFLGIGSYAVAILAAHGIDEILLQTSVAIVAALLFAALTSAVSLRASGVYYIMSTLAFGQMLYFFAVSMSAYGGDDGISLEGRSRLLGYHVLGSDMTFYYVVLAVLMGCYGATVRVVGSRFGRVLNGIRENPWRMRAIGFEPFPYQMTACAIAGVMCAIAGVLLANQTGFVSPAYMTWQRSGDLLVIVIVGGIGSLWGAIVGAIAYLLLQDALSSMTEDWKLILGVILIVVALASHGGLAAAVTRVSGRARKEP